jgi:hypothetical protein
VNNSLANRVELVIGVSEIPVIAQIRGKGFAATNLTSTAGLGINALTTNSASLFLEAGWGTASASSPLVSDYSGFPSTGYNFLQWLEYARRHFDFLWRCGRRESSGRIDGEGMGINDVQFSKALPGNHAGRRFD